MNLQLPPANPYTSPSTPRPQHPKSSYQSMSAPELCGYDKFTPFIHSPIPNDDSSMSFTFDASKPLHRTSNESGTTLLGEPHVRTFHLAHGPEDSY